MHRSLDSRSFWKIKSVYFISRVKVCYKNTGRVEGLRTEGGSAPPRHRRYLILIRRSSPSPCFFSFFLFSFFCRSSPSTRHLFLCEPRAHKRLTKQKFCIYQLCCLWVFGYFVFLYSTRNSPPLCNLKWQKKKSCFLFLFFFFKPYATILFFISSFSLFSLQKLKMSKWEIGQSVAPVMHSNFSSFSLLK